MRDRYRFRRVRIVAAKIPTASITHTTFPTTAIISAESTDPHLGGQLPLSPTR
jgi:hypothetical protein